MMTFRDCTTELKYDWSECYCQMICPCGHKLILNDEPVECACGRIYDVQMVVQVSHEPEAQP